MKKLIDINGCDSVITYELKANTKPNSDNMCEASYKVDNIRTYIKMYNEHGESIGFRTECLTREEILKMYRALEEIENIPMVVVNANSLDDGLPF